MAYKRRYKFTVNSTSVNRIESNRIASNWVFPESPSSSHLLYCPHIDRVFHFYRASVCESGLGSRNSVCPPVRPSVCLSHAWIVTKLNEALRIFWYHTKGQSLCYSDNNSGWWATPPSLWNLRSKWPTPSKNADFDQFPLITSQP